MRFVRKRLSENDIQPAGTRWNADCDCVQVTNDGGITWVDDPGLDPRTNPALLLPPNTGPDVKCAAAAGMTEYFRHNVDARIREVNVIGLANATFAIVGVFIPVGVIVGLFFAVSSAMLTYAAAIVEAAFTEDVYDDIRNLLYCLLDADGRIDDAGYDEFRLQLASSVGNVVVDGMVDLAFQMAGVVGLSNAGAKLADPDAECESCGWCEVYDFAISDYGFTGTMYLGEPLAVWVDGVGFIANAAGGEYHQRAIFIERVVDAAQVTLAQFDFTQIGADGHISNYCWNNAGDAFSGAHCTASISPSPLIVEPDPYLEFTTIGFGMDNGGPGHPTLDYCVPRIVLEGNLDPPGIGEPC